MMNERLTQVDSVAYGAIYATPLKMPEFRPINRSEYELVSKMLDRGRLHESLKTRNLLDARVGYIEDGNFTVAMLMRHTFGGYQMVHSGSAKRITYAPMEDSNDPEIGRTLAFCRAICSEPIGLPPLETGA